MNMEKTKLFRIIDLFAGIGTASLAADLVWDNVEHTMVEWNPYGQTILRKHFPLAKIHGDITTYHYDGQPIDLLWGSPPCQAASSAGKRKGTADDRWLWPDYFRVLRESKARWCVAENVQGLLSLNGGSEYEALCASMEAEGYEVRAFLIPASAVGAPHRRSRIWLIGHRIDDTPGDRRTGGGSGTEAEEGHAERPEPAGVMEGGFEGPDFDVADPHLPGGASLGDGTVGDWKAYSEERKHALGGTDGHGGDVAHPPCGQPRVEAKWEGGQNTGGGDCQTPADPQGVECQRSQSEGDRRGEPEAEAGDGDRDASDSPSLGQQGQGEQEQSGDSKEGGNGETDHALDGGQQPYGWKPDGFPTWDGIDWRIVARETCSPTVASSFCELDDGPSSGLPRSSKGIKGGYFLVPGGEKGRELISEAKNRVESLKALGNGLVLPLVVEIFRAIKEADSQLN